MRKLATIQTIKNIAPISGADMIETISFNKIGWKCVAKKGEFEIGQKCVYFEIDSFLPIEDKYEFLRKSSYQKMYTGQEGFQLKTIELRKQVSQGLALPLSLFPELLDKEEGDDVSKELNVIKYEKYYEDDNLAGNFPGYISKSEQTRIQNLLEFWDLYKDLEFEQTMKLDGSSTTLYTFENNLGICGHNAELNKIMEVPQWNLVSSMGLNVALKELKKDIALQMEFMGPGIQGNREKLNEKDLFLFNVFNIQKSKFTCPNERYDIFEALKERVFQISGIEFKHTPILNKRIKVLELYPTLEAILDFVNGPSLFHKIKEGDVFKSVDYVDDKIIQFKVISNKYLLKGGE